jgi:import inner membrane translocase subunit TIM23
MARSSANQSDESAMNSRVQDPSQVLRNATFSKNESTPTFSDNNTLTASDLLLGAYDPTKLHPLAEIGDKLEYLLLEDDKTTDLPGADTAIPSRGWRDDMCYGTGTMYLSGMWRIFICTLHDCHVISASGPP